MKTRTFIHVSVVSGIILVILLLALYFVSIFFPNNSSSEAKYWRKKAEKLEKENVELKQEMKQKETETESSRDNSKKIILELERKLSTFEKKVEELSNKLLKEEEVLSTKERNFYEMAKIALPLLFPNMEFDYEIRDPSVKFYTDPSCEEKFLIKKELTWIGYVDRDFSQYDKTTNSTYTYYISAIVDADYEDGYSLVYSKRQPILYSIK